MDLELDGTYDRHGEFCIVVSSVCSYAVCQNEHEALHGDDASNTMQSNRKGISTVRWVDGAAVSIVTSACFLDFFATVPKTQLYSKNAPLQLAWGWLICNDLHD